MLEMKLPSLATELGQFPLRLPKAHCFLDGPGYHIPLPEVYIQKLIVRFLVFYISMEVSNSAFAVISYFFPCN
jgi:hypothetical protein